jgi:outer membrane lipoprotein SlyB
MAEYRSLSPKRRAAAALALGALIATAATVGAQSRRWEALSQIPTGTTVQVRATQPIRSSSYDGRIYQGIVDQDVLDAQGRLAIPNGATAELMVRRTGDNEFIIDLESVDVNGRRYAVDANANVVGTSGDRRDPNIGVNKETGKYVGGGAIIGSIIGAVAGGAKGAAIGAGVGAAAGAGAQIATHGGTIDVPAEALLSYRLTRPLNLDIRDTGYDREGVHYHRCPGC